MRSPPSATLFPYTTLFRSAGGAVRAVMNAAGVRDVLTKCIGYSNPHNVIRATFEGLSNLRSPEGIARLRGRTVEDRKSTRLNSSHSQISYAVFCLKKKN